MDVMNNKKFAYCVDSVTVHHHSKVSFSYLQYWPLYGGAPVLQGSKKPGINRVKDFGLLQEHEKVIQVYIKQN